MTKNAGLRAVMLRFCRLNMCFIKQLKFFIQEEWLNAEED